MAEVIPQINIDGTKIKNTWTEKEYVTDEVYNALNKAVIDLKNNNNLLDSTSILFRGEYNSSSKNLNNAIHQGVYSFTSSAVNAPSGVNGGNLLVTNTSKTNQGSSIITQIAFCHNGAVYARTKNTIENFTAWNKLAYITDNVASATKATQDSNGKQITTTYLNRAGGDIIGSIDDVTTEGIYTYSTYTTGNAPTTYGRLLVLNSSYTGQDSYTWLWQLAFDTAGKLKIRESINGGSWTSWSEIAYTNSPAFSGTPTAPTPGTTENSTRIATTAYARSLLQRAVGKTQPTLTGLIDWEAMKSANGGEDVRNIKNTSSGITAYGGDVRALNNGDIILKQAFTNFDALLIRYTHDDGWWNKTVIIPIWEFNIMFNTKGFFQLLKEENVYWQIRGNGHLDRPSTTTRLNAREQNCGIIEIYGITY